jgi:hypothetical protein
MSYWLGDVWNGFFDFVSGKSVVKADKARKGCVGRNGEDTLVARARRATTDHNAPHARAGHRSAIRIGSQGLSWNRNISDLVTELRTNRANSNGSRNGEWTIPGAKPQPAQAIEFPYCPRIPGRDGGRPDDGPVTTRSL